MQESHEEEVFEQPAGGRRRRQAEVHWVGEAEEEQVGDENLEYNETGVVNNNECRANGNASGNGFEKRVSGLTGGRKANPEEDAVCQVSVPVCSICCEPLFSDLRCTPCGHIFHNKCINQWLIQGAKTLCPVCRKTITHKTTITVHYRLDDRGGNSQINQERKDQIKELTRRIYDLKEEIKATVEEKHIEAETHGATKSMLEKTLTKYRFLKKQMQECSARLKGLEEKKQQYKEYIKISRSLSDPSMETARELEAKAKDAMAKQRIIAAQYVINKDLYDNNVKLLNRNRQWHLECEGMKKKLAQKSEDVKRYETAMFREASERERLRSEIEQLQGKRHKHDPPIRSSCSPPPPPPSRACVSSSPQSSTSSFLLPPRKRDDAMKKSFNPTTKAHCSRLASKPKDDVGLIGGRTNREADDVISVESSDGMEAGRKGETNFEPPPQEKPPVALFNQKATIKLKRKNIVGKLRSSSSLGGSKKQKILSEFKDFFNATPS